MPPLPAGRRGEWGVRGGGVALWFPTSLLRGVCPWPPSQPPFFAGAFSPGILVRPGSSGSPRRQAWLGRPSVRQPGRGGGAARRPVRGLGRGLSSRLPRAGTQAGHSICAPPSILHSRVPPSRRGLRGALECRRRAVGLLRKWRE